MVWLFSGTVDGKSQVSIELTCGKKFPGDGGWACMCNFFFFGGVLWEREVNEP